MTPNILILGAGYGGLHAARMLHDLAHALGLDTTVTLLDRSPQHQIIQSLHRAIADKKLEQQILIPIREILGKRAIRVVQGEATSIRLDSQQVTLREGDALAYDQLVIALGSRPNTSRVAGASQHALPLRFYADAQRLREHLLGCFRRAAAMSDLHEQQKLLTTIIVGGGYTGCELAGELAPWFARLCTQYGLPSGLARVIVLEYSTHLLDTMGVWAHTEAMRILGHQGVQLRTNAQVVRVAEDHVLLANGEVLATGTTIWAGGTCAPQLLGESGLAVDDQGRVITEHTLRARGQENVFAIGDCARILDEQGFPLPATASYALRQGEHVARVIVAALQARPLPAYTPVHLGKLVALGPGTALGDPLGVPTTGLPALLLKHSLERWYQSLLQPGVWK